MGKVQRFYTVGIPTPNECKSAVASVRELMSQGIMSNRTDAERSGVLMASVAKCLEYGKSVNLGYVVNDGKSPVYNIWHNALKNANVRSEWHNVTIVTLKSDTVVTGKDKYGTWVEGETTTTGRDVLLLISPVV